MDNLTQLTGLADSEDSNPNRSCLHYGPGGKCYLESRYQAVICGTEPCVLYTLRKHELQTQKKLSDSSRLTK